MPRPERDPELARIGTTLRTIRQLRGLRPVQFAEALNISRPYLVNIESGRKRLTPELLVRAAYLLDVPQAAIVRGDYFSQSGAA